MDYTPTDGETFYTPEPPVEQVAEDERVLSATQAALPYIEEEIKGFQEMYDYAKSIEGIEIGKGINTDAQILAKSIIAQHAKDRLDHYINLRNSVDPKAQEVSP